jgi:A/G-specific adenine glycosylase
MASFNFAKALLRWFDDKGRKDLPWQRGITPYRIWISEVMLQQTQVATVIPYFNRFIHQFPTIDKLATAPADQVLQLWTGLGYYSRARNLHKAARIISHEHDGVFPDTLDALIALPGIGRSTAGAILALGFKQRAAILDGNVKRVLARFHGIDGWPGESQVAAALWQHAEQHTPTQRVSEYTQAIMDLGALVCTRTRPDCPKCPLHKHCTAYQQDTIAACPGKKPRKTLPVRSTQLLMIRNSKGEVLLQRRPDKGIWGGLWCFPEIDSQDDATHAAKQLCGKKPKQLTRWASWRHTFSHYHLDITPVLIKFGSVTLLNDPGANSMWIDPKQPASAIGLAAPTCKLLDQLATW